ncbi:ankyrin repeat domain-containing protein [Williamsia deligens]|uniref:Ankyrin repeat domain-containing protein n=1 Tax=Williamsia deligens TaxID=321325 RepID=A0ABW3G2N0_9NOCA|nr:ankyrin repeat domain-containing protein [Williamsia deligens]MCP2194730.1 Ankyrin repeat-containing protein [Williamsia deligens]
MATLPERPDLDWLRRHARDIARGVRGGDASVLETVGLDGPDPAFRLADAQRWVARSHGFASWPRLRSHVRAIADRTWTPTPHTADEPPEHAFVRAACETWTGTPPDLAAAEAIRAGHPDIGHDPAVAAITGDVATVRDHLTTHEADAACGPFGWPMLMYLAYSRWPTDESAAAAVVAALLDAGADPDGGRHVVGHATPFTVLTGLFGGGENDESPHPHLEVLAPMLLRAGAEPTDAQVLYNRMFGDDDGHLRLLLPFGLGTGDGGPWRRRLPDLIPAPDVILRQQLAWAVVHGQRDRVALLADHGVDVISPLPDGPGPLRVRGTPIAVAAQGGHADLVDLLRERGAEEPALDDVQALTAAILSGDTDAVDASDPAVRERARRRHPGLAAWAATRGVPAVSAAIAAGVDIDGLGRGDAPIDQPWQTALHTAVERDDVELIRWLIEHGADTTIRDARFDATPGDWADHLDHPRSREALRGSGGAGT